MASSRLPLSDLRVVEFCQVAAGPFCGMLLADMGADVIKVEAPEGDGLRSWPPLAPGRDGAAGFSENFASLNRNKRSIVLDLKDTSQRRDAKRLALSADVLIENFRPGVMSRLGVGYDEIAREKPSIVYCSISAFGQDGPRAREGGFDLTVQAISGVMSVTGEAEGKPAKCGVPISDFCSGLYAAFAIVAAVRKAKRDGVGTHIDCSMLGATLGVAALQTSEYFGNDRDPLRLGSAHPRNAPYQAFGVSNGYVAIAAGNDRLWKSACQAIGRTDLLDDPRFGSISLRARHQVALREILEAEFVRYTAVELLARLTEHGVPCAPVNTYAQALADPQVARMGWVVPLKLPNGALTRTFGFPLRMLGERFDIYRTPPLLGQHTDEVMAELGLRLEDGK